MSTEMQSWLVSFIVRGGGMANDRIEDFINTISNEELALSAGSVYGFCKSLDKKAQTSIGKLEEELLNQRVVSTDTI